MSHHCSIPGCPQECGHGTQEVRAPRLLYDMVSDRDLAHWPLP